jgi:DNA repair exonuclease SbcCD ATPase subunit
MATVTALDQASQRLSQAFAMLEERLNARQPEAEMTTKLEQMQQKLAGQWQAHYDDLEAEKSALTAERDELMRDNETLRNELHALKQDFMELQSFNEKIAARVDEQVSQLELIAG